LQFLEDSAAPDTATVLAQVFAIRIALNMGQAFITNLLSSAHVGTTSASSFALTAAEVSGLVTKVSNAAYAFRPKSGWLMSADTYNYVTTLTGTGSGLFVFPRKKNDQGQWTLMDYPVWISPNMPDIGATSQCIAFGDWDKFLIRQVQDSMTLFRYLERYMVNYHTAFQAWWRAESVC
jgi:HK97 family phage major capsid protein